MLELGCMVWGLASGGSQRATGRHTASLLTPDSPSRECLIPSPQSLTDNSSVLMKWPQLRTQLWEWRGVWLTVPSVAGLVLVVRFAGWLQPFEWGALDLFFRLRSIEPVDSRIAIVGIDESDINALGQWPISDAVLARLLEKLKQQQPRAIGLDIYRNLPVQPGHENLVEIFESTPNLIGIQKVVGDDNREAVASSPVLKKLNQVGSNDVPVDGDGTIRRGLLFVKTPEGNALESLGLRLALMYLEAEGIEPKAAAIDPRYMQLGEAVFRRLQENDGGYLRADVGGYQILLNYRGPAGSFETVSLMDVLDEKIPADWARDRIVLIGPTAVSLNDFFDTPYSSTLFGAARQTTGVEIQANLIGQILSAATDGRPLFQFWEEPFEALWIFLWSGVGGILSWSLRGTRRILASVLLCSGMVGGVSFFVFLSGWWVPVIPPLIAMTSSAIITLGYIASIERQERKMVMHLFGRHVTPTIAEAIWRDRHQILKEGRLVGKKVQATVLFTDIKNFSTIAEETDPEVLMCWLNEYMEAMAELVLEHGGIVDKFIGDAVMAVFGVPIPRTTPEEVAADAVAAVRCAVAMAEKLRSLNQQWQGQGHPMVTMRVGISSGTVVIGSLGSSQREDYTTIGDSVNVAARLESYNKGIEGGICRILISESTFFYVEGLFPTRYLGSTLLKGRQHPVGIYQISLNEFP